jgi:hypothetical protein
MQHDNELALLRLVFETQLRRHPLPWRVERDWTFEVKSLDHAIIAKCMTHEQATAIISLAEEIKASRSALEDIELPQGCLD